MLLTRPPRLPTLSSAALTATAAGFAMLPLLLSSPAEACGGFFCSTGPVDQQQETILFEVHETGEVSATVEVSFNGDPGAFSWVIPVPEAPTVSVVPQLTLDILDVVSRPQIIPPDLDYSNCEDFNNNMIGRGIGCSDGDAFAAADTGRQVRLEPEAGPEDGVIVTEIPRVGAFDQIVFVETVGADPQVLVDWLNTNGYIITPAMEPLIADYVAEGWGFLATKLAPDAGVGDISPLRFTCPNAFPRLPLRLTAIAAQPNMRISVHVLGAEKYASMNYRGINIDRDDVRFSYDSWEDNYDEVVAWQVNDAGGRAFVTERAGPTNDLRSSVSGTNASGDDEQEAKDYVLDLLEASPYHTRLFTIMNAGDMNDDPIFAASGGEPVDQVVDLRNRPAIDACPPAGEATDLGGAVCGFAFCGSNSRCATDESGNEGCECAPGTSARQLQTRLPFGGLQAVVGCQAIDEDMLGDDLDLVGDPCAGFGCGNDGTCVAINGFPTCDCPDGTAAFVDTSLPGGVKCRTQSEVYDVTTLRPEAPPGGFPATRGALPSNSCASSTRIPGALELAGLFGAAWMLVRRRRKRNA